MIIRSDRQSGSQVSGARSIPAVTELVQSRVARTSERQAARQP